MIEGGGTGRLAGNILSEHPLCSSGWRTGSLARVKKKSTKNTRILMQTGKYFH